MTLLCIETSTNVCSAAWCIDDQCVAQRTNKEGSNHAALLPKFIQELLVEAQQNGWQADAVAVSEGPGSYTGLRIGVCTAKGLCFGWNVPLIAVPTLDILVQSLLVDYPLPTTPLPTTPLPTTLVPMLDARRMEVYTALYHTESNEWVPSPVKAQIVDNSEWLPQDTTIYYFGDGAAKCQTVLKHNNAHFIDQIIPKASVMGEVVCLHHYPLIGEKELAYYTPFYLKEFIAAPSHIKGLK